MTARKVWATLIAAVVGVPVLIIGGFLIYAIIGGWLHPLQIPIPPPWGYLVLAFLEVGLLFAVLKLMKRLWSRVARV